MLTVGGLWRRIALCMIAALGNVCTEAAGFAQDAPPPAPKTGEPVAAESPARAALIRMSDVVIAKDWTAYAGMIATGYIEAVLAEEQSSATVAEFRADLAARMAGDRGKYNTVIRYEILAEDAISEREVRLHCNYVYHLADGGEFSEAEYWWAVLEADGWRLSPLGHHPVPAAARDRADAYLRALTTGDVETLAGMLSPTFVKQQAEAAMISTEQYLADFKLMSRRAIQDKANLKYEIVETAQIQPGRLDVTVNVTYETVTDGVVTPMTVEEQYYFIEESGDWFAVIPRE